MSRFFAIVAIMVLIVTLGSVAIAQDQPSGNLTLMLQEANQGVFEETTLPGFLEMYPDIEIEWINFPPDEVANQVALSIMGGTGAPDLAVTENRSIAQLVELGGLMDLSDRLSPYIDQINPTILDLCSKDGGIYCVPWDIGPVVMFYRRDIFDAAGLPSDPESVNELVATWDSFFDTCTTIKEETGLDCFALNKANSYGDYLFNILWSRGIGFFNENNEVTIDSPEVIESLEKLGEFWEADLVSDALEWTDQWYAELNASIDGETEPFATVMIGAWMGSFLKSWIAPDQAGNWGVAMMPAWEEGGVRAANQGGSNLFIPEDSENPEAAWAFIEYMVLNPEVHVQHFAFSDYFPAITSTYEFPIFEEEDPYFGGQVTRELYAEVAQQLPSAPIYGEFGITMSNNTATAMQNYALGNMSAEEALQEAAAAVRLETGLD